jgi:hypothetical protein
VKYFFQPGQKLICQRQNRPAKDFGLLSYFDRKVQLLHLLSAMITLHGIKRFSLIRGLTVRHSANHKVMPLVKDGGERLVRQHKKILIIS